MPFAQPTNRGIARHDANSIGPHRHQCCAHTTARGGMGRFCASMPTADDNHIISGLFHVKHLSLSNAELRKNRPENRFYIHTPNKRVKRRHCITKMQRQDLGAGIALVEYGARF